MQLIWARSPCPVLKKLCLGSDLIAAFEVRQLNRKALTEQMEISKVSRRKAHLDSATTLPGLSGGGIRQPKAVVGDELRLDRLLETHLEANSLTGSQHNCF